MNNLRTEVKMDKTNFENLEIYQLSEKLADEIWDIVLSWNNFGTGHNW